MKGLLRGRLPKCEVLVSSHTLDGRDIILAYYWREFVRERLGSYGYGTIGIFLVMRYNGRVEKCYDGKDAGWTVGGLE